MSGFGRPPSKIIFSPTPPERGSFPLDHDGECRPAMASYLACLKAARGTNEMECRLLAKAYLQCRMDNGLMAQDEFKNLGFQEEGKAVEGEGEVRGEGKGKGKQGDRLEELRRENRELLRKHREDGGRQSGGRQ